MRAALGRALKESAGQAIISLRWMNMVNEMQRPCRRLQELAERCGRCVVLEEARNGQRGGRRWRRVADTKVPPRLNAGAEAGGGEGNEPNGNLHANVVPSCEDTGEAGVGGSQARNRLSDRRSGGMGSSTVPWLWQDDSPAAGAAVALRAEEDDVQTGGRTVSTGAWAERLSAGRKRPGTR